MLSGIHADLKVIHASCALLTLVLFIWRGRLAIDGRDISRRWLRRVPDSVDTLLLATGVGLVFVTGQYPFAVGWLTVKLLAVMVYIALGFVVFRFARSRRQRRVAWIAAMGVFFAIVWLAWAQHLPFY